MTGTFLPSAVESSLATARAIRVNNYVHQVSQEESARIRRFLYLLATGTVVFVLVIAIAILTADRWLMAISPASEREFMRPYIEWAGEHFLQQADPVLQDYVVAMGQQIAADMNLPEQLELEFQVIEGDTVNAFTTLGGYVFVFEGLVREVESENSLSMVLAHEIAHAKNRDPLLATGRGVLLQIMISSLSGSGGIDPTATELGSDLMLNIYSREQEEAADRIALTAVQSRYGHVGGATRLFRLIQDSDPNPGSIELSSTHPDIDQRIDYIEGMTSKMGWSVREETPHPEEVRTALTKSL
jgi:predicted Zn-dependent protease